MQGATKTAQSQQPQPAEDPAKTQEDAWGYYMPETQLVATPREIEDAVTPIYYAAA